jgi:hypothetical protein
VLLDLHGVVLVVRSEAERVRNQRANHRSAHLQRRDRQIQFSGARNSAAAMWQRAGECRHTLSLRSSALAEAACT